MKIYSVLVDEVPENCWDCPMFDFDFKGFLGFKKERPYCIITGKDILIDYKSARSNSCPLEKKGGWIIDDPVVVKMIQNREGWFTKRVVDKNGVVTEKICYTRNGKLLE